MDEQSMLIQAMKERNSELVEELLLSAVAGVNVGDPKHFGKNVLAFAAQSGDGEMVELLLERGANASATDEYGESALHLASMNGHYNVCRMLVKNGASPIAGDCDNETPFSDAVYNDHVEVVAYYLSLPGVADNINHADHEGATSLHHAFQNSSVEMIQLLFNHGASDDVTDIYGKRPSDLAKYNDNHPEVQGMMMKD